MKPEGEEMIHIKRKDLSSIIEGHVRAAVSEVVRRFEYLTEDEFLDRKFHYIRIGSPKAADLCDAAGIKTIRDLTQFSKKQLLSTPGFPKVKHHVQQIEDALARHGLTLKP
jgi:hypothetical protein